MLDAQKAALQNNIRRRLVAIREHHHLKELDYYAVNCRSVGNQAALIAGFAYSGIRYHYLLEHQAGWHLSQQNTIEEVIFLTLLTLSMGCGLQAVVLSMSVSIMAPVLALRGPDGSLHDAILGMQKWTSFVIVLFLSSILLLQLGALSLSFGHTQIGTVPRFTCCAVVVILIICTVYYAKMVVKRFALDASNAVSGSFFVDQGNWQSRPFRDRGLSCRKSKCAATTINDHELLPLTGMEFLDGEARDESSEHSSSSCAGHSHGRRPQQPAQQQPATDTPPTTPGLSAVSWAMMALDGRAYQSDGTRIRGSGLR